MKLAKKSKPSPYRVQTGFKKTHKVKQMPQARTPIQLANDSQEPQNILAGESDDEHYMENMNFANENCGGQPSSPLQQLSRSKSTSNCYN